ncbi:hypothetical protein HK101_005650 [Irineochytrium annulatum]|nr:hypothetical protein HK101_005650 [Irineochytrium annulatum]
MGLRAHFVTTFADPRPWLAAIRKSLGQLSPPCPVIFYPINCPPDILAEEGLDSNSKPPNPEDIEIAITFPRLKLIASYWAGVDGMLMKDDQFPKDVTLVRLVDPEPYTGGAGPNEVKTLHGSDGFEALVRQSEIVVNLLPLTRDTKWIFCKKTFDMMPRGVTIINLARGGHVNEPELLDALNDGRPVPTASELSVSRVIVVSSKDEEAEGAVGLSAGITQISPPLVTPESLPATSSRNRILTVDVNVPKEEEDDIISLNVSDDEEMEERSKGAVNMKQNQTPKTFP